MTQSIFITGSSGGLGRATALLFAARGWRVFATLRSPHDHAELASVPGVTLLRLDVTDPEQLAAAAAEALSHGPIDVVFANAGYALGGPLEAATDAQIEREIATNLLGPIRTIKAFLPHFRERRAGTFLLTSSATGYVGMPLLSTYSATKFALEGLAQSLSHELATLGVAVKTIVPGSMQTNFLQSAVVASHPAYAALAQRAFGFFASGAANATDGAPELVAESVWNAATDGSLQVAYFVTDEARQVRDALAQGGAEGFRATIRGMLAP